MLTPDQISGLQIVFERLCDPITEYLIQDIARSVSEAGKLTSTAAYQIWKAEKLGKHLDEVKKEVAKLTDKSLDEVQELFEQAGKFGYLDDIKRLSGGVAFADNGSIQQIIAAAVKLAREDLSNIVQTIGFIGSDGGYGELSQAYIKATDYAFTKTVTGATDYNTAIRRACNGLAERGIITIDYASGIRTALEAAIRRNMMGGLGLMVEEISQRNHDDLVADGWEISAHAASAPDHEPIQGRQYPDAEYEALNNSLKRRIGTLNCGHNAFPIIIGVNEPQYSMADLEKFRADNEKGVSYDGRTFKTVYEATQYQRRIERSIRAQKRRVMIAENQPNEDRKAQEKTRLKALRAEYKRFCSATGLRTEDERLFVSGFGRKR